MLIDAGKRYWLKSSSRRQRVRVQPQTTLDLNSGLWNETDSLPLNAIGTVQLIFDETAIFDPYDTNRDTGAFVLIDPDSHNTVAGGMVVARSDRPASFENAGDRDHVLISLPGDLADQLMESEAFSVLRNEVDIRRVSAKQATSLMREFNP